VLGEAISVIGGGAWGTGLAVYLGRHGHAVRLWVREPELVERIQAHRDNPVFLPDVPVPAGVTALGSLREAVAGTGVAIAAIPSAFAREVYRQLAPHLPATAPVVVATKGIEAETLAFPLDVVAQELGTDRRRAVVSGPSFAAELARGKPTAVVVASGDAGLAYGVQRLLSSSELRLYTSADVVGVQLAGALKNVIAIASGIADSLGMGPNGLAALVTRGLAEMARLGAAMGAQPATFAGLAGLGDLVLTCTGGLSRNRQVGQRLGRGERLDAILESMQAVAEGVRTTRAARDLARAHGIEMPIVEELHRILFEGGEPQLALRRLMDRPLIAEELYGA